MGDTAIIVDQRRSARTTTMPGALLVATAALAFVICLAGFAVRHVGVGVAAAIVMLLAAGAAMCG